MCMRAIACVHVILRGVGIQGLVVCITTYSGDGQKGDTIIVCATVINCLQRWAGLGLVVLIIVCEPIVCTLCCAVAYWCRLN